MKSILSRALLSLLSLWMLAGCSSVAPRIDRARSLKGIQHFFVVTNLNDNHAIDRHIVAVLQSHGLDASNGPLTMMPDDAQAVVNYQDRWSWDFGDHLMAITINIHQANSERQFANADFQVRVPLRKSPADIISDLVEQLLYDPKADAAAPVQK